MQLDVHEVADRISKLLPERRPIEHHEPQINGRESQHLAACFAKGLTGYDYVRRMEERLIEITGASQALVTSSGTAALHLAIMAAGVTPGDEVLVPALTFVATANAVVHAGAVPNFVDGAININPYKLHQYLARETKKVDGKRINRLTERPVTALIVVDLLGIPAAMPRLTEVAAEFGLTLIEDASQALGSKVGNTSCGNFGVVSTLSFNSNKIVTTGGGGALLTNDEWLLAKAYQLGTTARVPHQWLVEHDAVAWNYRMPNVCAAIGVAQLEQLDNFLNKKRILSQRYQRVLSSCPGIKFVEQPEGANCWLNAILVDHPEDRDVLLGELHQRGIKARAVFTPLYKLPMYKDNPRDNMGYANDTAARMICLPSGATLCE